MMKQLRNNSEKNYLAGLYSPAKRRFLQQAPEDLTVGGRLRRERILRKLTIEQMASFLNISACYLGSIERGQRPRSFRTSSTKSSGSRTIFFWRECP